MRDIGALGLLWVVQVTLLVQLDRYLSRVFTRRARAIGTLEWIFLMTLFHLNSFSFQATLCIDNISFDL